MTQQAHEKRPLECARCGCRHFVVVEVLETRGGVRTRRTCRHCGRAARTFERADLKGIPPAPSILARLLGRAPDPDNPAAEDRADR